MMAVVSKRRLDALDAGFVLAPERYDPRRSMMGVRKSTVLSEIVSVVKVISPPADAPDRCLVLDTSDVREGIVIGRKEPTSEIGSAKKSTRPGDVIVSRLRPYLRQVAFVDQEIANLEGAALLCSTEFFVLRGQDARSIAFLAPYLLSQQVQEVFAASQEGGHHPRFHESTLLTLPVPAAILRHRDASSRKVEDAVREYRRSEATIAGLVAAANRSFGVSE